jgi:hypothetical protein
MKVILSIPDEGYSRKLSKGPEQVKQNSNDTLTASIFV